MFACYVISELWHGTGSWNSSSWKTRSCLSYLVNTMSHDAQRHGGSGTGYAGTRDSINQRLNPENTSHISPWRASCGVSFVNILEKIDRALTAPPCSWFNLCHFHSLSNQCNPCSRYDTERCMTAPRIINATWRCRETFSQWERIFHWKLRCRC